MVFSVLLAACTAVASVLTSDSNLDSRSDYSTSNDNVNFYSSFWTDHGAKVEYKNGPAGQYSVTWDGNGNFVAGKGWNTGGARLVNFSGDYQPNGYSYLSVYGWTTNPLIEYYIVESYGPGHEPAAEGDTIGNFTSDGSSYILRTKMRVNKPSIQGTTTFRQLFSVRQDKRDTGVVNTTNHYKAWTDAGYKLGQHNYMIVATEGLNSSGTSDMTVY